MKEIITNIIESLLSIQYYCTSEQLRATGTIYSINTDTGQPYIKILSYRDCMVICTSIELHDKMKKVLQGKTKDEIFENPYVYGQTIHYVPDGDYEDPFSALPDYEYEFLTDENILQLRRLKGFENSLSFDDYGFTPTKAAFIAKDKGKVAGIAGAANSSVDGLWEIGVDVVGKYRNVGLGTYLVKNLTRELLSRDIIPFYSASVTNVGSQMVTGRCGYVPLWVDTFGTIFDGSSVYKDIVCKLL